MPWSSKYQAKFTKALKWQLLAIVNRDMQAALDFVSGVPGSLPTFVHYHTAAVAIEQFPSLLLATVAQRHSRERGAGQREYEATFYAALAVQHQDPSRVADLCEDYVRAFDAVLISAWELTLNDFYATNIPLPAPLFQPGSLSPGLQAGSLLQMHIDDAAYDEARQLRRAKGFAQAAVMRLAFEMLEV